MPVVADERRKLGKVIASATGMTDDRARRLALVVLFVNVTLLTLGVLAYAWKARRDASWPLAPTHFAQLRGHI